MGLNVGGLGSFAGGMAQGLERGQFMSLQQQRMGLANAAEERLRQAAERQARMDARQESLIADDEAARAAGAKVIQDAQAEYASQWNQQQPGPTMDGGIVQPAPMPQFQPDDKLVLKAAKAHSTELFKRGRTDEAVKAWSIAEARRAQMRGAAAQNVMATLQMGGDIKKALADFDDTFDNGHTIQDVKQTAGPDGRPVFVITRVDDAGNQTPPMQLSAQQLGSMVQQMTMDPKQAATAALQEKLAVSKHLMDMAEIEARGRESRTTDNTRTVNDKSLATHKAGLDRGLIAARGAEDRQTKERVGGGDVAGERQALIAQSTAANHAVGKAGDRVKEAQKALDNAFDDAAKAAAKMELREAKAEREDATARRKAIDDELTAFRSRKSGGLSDTTSPTAPRGLPAGAKQIGTSGGKPVFQTPDGKRFIAD